MSMANDLALAVAERLTKITKDNGYQTDIGKKVFRGRRKLDPKLLPCAVLIERDDEPGDQSNGTVKIKQPYVLEGHVECDPDNPNDVAHAVISDIKRAIFTEKMHLDDRFKFGATSRALGISYTGRSISPREDGLAVVSAAVEISISYVEQLSNP